MVLWRWKRALWSPSPGTGVTGEVIFLRSFLFLFHLEKGFSLALYHTVEFLFFCKLPPSFVISRAQLPAATKDGESRRRDGRAGRRWTKRLDTVFFSGSLVPLLHSCGYPSSSGKIINDRPRRVRYPLFFFFTILKHFGVFNKRCFDLTRKFSCPRFQVSTYFTNFPWRDVEVEKTKSNRCSGKKIHTCIQVIKTARNAACRLFIIGRGMVC